MPKPSAGQDEAEIVALEVLAYIASFPAVFAEFLKLTGFACDEVTGGADSLEVQIAVLDFLTRDESLLVSFCSHKHYKPTRILAALKALDPAYDW